MSGVIVKGIQYEHCCHCGNFVKLEDLMIGYSTRWPAYPEVDLCTECKELDMVEENGLGADPSLRMDS